MPVPNWKQQLGALGRTVEGREATRVVSAGGALSDLLMHPSFVPFQRVYRASPTRGVFEASPRRPFTFELGSYVVDKGQALAVAQHQFLVYRYVGDTAGNVEPVDPRALGLSIGYDVNVSGNRPANLEAQILPSDPGAAQNAFVPSPAAVIAGQMSAFELPAGFPTAFSNPDGGIGPAVSAYSLLGGVANLAEIRSQEKQNELSTLGAGNAILPQTPDDLQGPRRYPFTFYVQATQSVQLRVLVFGPVELRIAFFECSLAGYLMPQNVLAEMLQAVAPTGTAGQGR